MIHDIASVLRAALEPPAGDTHTADFYFSLVGSFVAGCFSLYLASLIRQLIEPKPTDKWLAFVMVSFGLVSFLATLRLTLKLIYIPAIAPILWTLVIAACIGSTYHLRREFRMTRDQNG